MAIQKHLENASRRSDDKKFHLKYQKKLLEFSPPFLRAIGNIFNGNPLYWNGSSTDMGFDRHVQKQFGPRPYVVELPDGQRHAAGPADGTLIKIHDEKVSSLDNGKYSVCVDFLGANGTVYDVDFLLTGHLSFGLSGPQGDVEVTQVSLHRIK